MKRFANVTAAILVGSTVGLGGCAAAVGAGAAAGGYEYSNKQQLDKLNQQYQDGKISKQEYLQRKNEIEQGSVVY